MAKDNEITLTPNFGFLFDQFEREAKLQADNILLGIDMPDADTVEAWNRSRLSSLRAFHSVLSAANICAHSATSLAHIERLRDLMLTLTQTIEAKANRLEARIPSEDNPACECQDCGERHCLNELKAIKDYHERVMDGEPEPAGECPECGALCHEVKA